MSEGTDLIAETPDRMFSPICTYCKHVDGYPERTCAAFPAGVSDEIWDGCNDRSQPYPGDDGIQFGFPADVVQSIRDDWDKIKKPRKRRGR